MQYFTFGACTCANTLRELFTHIYTEWIKTYNPCILSSSVTSTDVTCYNYSNGTATASIIGGTQPYSYYWDYNSVTDPFTMYLPQGSHTCYITDANNCPQATSNFSIKWYIPGVSTKRVNFFSLKNKPVSSPFSMRA